MEVVYCYCSFPEIDMILCAVGYMFIRIHPAHRQIDPEILDSDAAYTAVYICKSGRN